jgi:hypothetical protein
VDEQERTSRRLLGDEWSTPRTRSPTVVALLVWTSSNSRRAGFCECCLRLDAIALDARSRSVAFRPQRASRWATETLAKRREATLVGRAPRAADEPSAGYRTARVFRRGRPDRERAPLLFMTTVLFDAEQPGETDQCQVVGEDGDDVGSAADLLDRGDGSA